MVFSEDVTGLDVSGIDVQLQSLCGGPEDITITPISGQEYLVAVGVNEDYLGPVRASIWEGAAYDLDGHGNLPSTSHDSLVISKRENLPPVVLDESIVVDYGETIVIDVLANDHDPDGDAMTLVSANAYGGEAAITAEGMISFTAPPEGSAGPGAIIFYLVSDGSCEESEGTVHVDYASDGD